MIHAYGKKISSAVVLLLAVIIGAVSAFADFYVIPVERQPDGYVLVKAKGTDAENGARLLAALAKITDASDTNRYLVVLEPGVYDIGSAPLQMQSYVDIRGFGQDLTTIKGNVEGVGSPPTSGVVMGANDSELRHLTVQHTGGVTCAAAVYNEDVSDSFTMSNVTAAASGETTATTLEFTITTPHPR